MFKKKDPNSFTEYFSLFDGTPVKNANGQYTNQIGYLVADYSVVPYEDVEANGASAAVPSSVRQYILHCTQRIVINNSSFFTLSPISFPLNSYPYENYPALIQTTVSVTPGYKTGFTLQLLDYSPKTVNTKVQTSGSTGIGSGNSQTSSISNTVGSSTSQTNSFSTTVGLDVGMMGDVPTFGSSVSATAENSSTSTQDQSSTAGSDSSSNTSKDVSSSNSMSMKDWGAYAMVNPINQQPLWYFGQEYPWDAIQCRLTDGKTNPNTTKNSNAGNQMHLILPADMSNRLYDGTILYPPSQMAMFGFNFVTKNAWLISVDYGLSGARGEIALAHDVFYYSASHSLSGNPGTVGVYLDNTPTGLKCNGSSEAIKTDLDLNIMALEVLGQPGKPAIIGFSQNNFTMLPGINPFIISSSTNTILVQDTTGYSGGYPTSTPPLSIINNCLAATFNQPGQLPLSISLYFKVVDSVSDYNLHMKHWKLSSTDADVQLSFTINGYTSDQLLKSVVATEGQGGESNLLTIGLRNQDFDSVDYHDYLKLGLNCIEIKIIPNSIQKGARSTYMLKALSIEEA